MKEFDDDDLEFDEEDIPDVDLSDLDLTENDSAKSQSKENVKTDDSEAPFEKKEIDDMIRTEAMKALDLEEDSKNIAPLVHDDEVIKRPDFLDSDEEDFGLGSKEKSEHFGLTVSKSTDIESAPEVPEVPEEKEESDGDGNDDPDPVTKKPRKKLKIALLIIFAVLGLLIGCGIFLAFTKAGNRLVIKMASGLIYDKMGTNIDRNKDTKEDTNVDHTGDPTDDEVDVPEIDIKEDGEDSGSGEIINPQSAAYVKTYLLFGIEKIGGGANTDAIILMSINTHDDTIKLTSIMRDTYVDIPGAYSNKINSVFAHGMMMEKSEDRAAQEKRGAELLMTVIQNTFNIEISGYAYVDFKDFESVIDVLGGIDLELGSSEASYLNNTNYISKWENRNVHAGMNHLNGNQVLGYCRVRKRATPDGNGGTVSNDHGRTLRHRKVINAVIQQCKDMSYISLLPKLYECLGYIQSNLTKEQIEQLLADVWEHKITKVQELKLPLDGTYWDSALEGKYNGKRNIYYTLVMGSKREENIKQLHDFVFTGDYLGEYSVE